MVMWEVESSGESFGTKVFYGGEDITNGIRSVTVHHEAGQPPLLTIEVMTPMVDAKGTESPAVTGLEEVPTDLLQVEIERRSLVEMLEMKQKFREGGPV